MMEGAVDGFVSLIATFVDLRVESRDQDGGAASLAQLDDDIGRGEPNAPELV